MVNILDRIGVHIISEHISVHIKSEFTFIPNTKASVILNPKSDHILDHKARFNKFKRNKIIHIMFSENNAVKLQINYQKNFRKLQICRN